MKTSEEVAKDFEGAVELIFIDGSHEHEAVKLDFELWTPKIVEGGIIAFHDTIYHKAPIKVVKNLLYKSKSFRNVQLLDTITFAEKSSNTSKKDKQKK